MFHIKLWVMNLTFHYHFKVGMYHARSYHKHNEAVQKLKDEVDRMLTEVTQ